jgi:small subunit ribosomal protein S3
MGQKVNPIGLRVGPSLIKDWLSVMYATKKDYASFVNQDIKIRKFVTKECEQSYVSKVVIERASNKSVTVNIHAKKPGNIIGKGGADIDKLKKGIQQFTTSEVNINIHEVKKADTDAQITATTIAQQIEKRASYRRAMKKAMQTAMKSGAKGIKVCVSGRLSGAEIARSEWYREGRVPLHTLRADIDYAVAEANTTYGVIGIKVWVYKGDVVDSKKINNNKG